QKQAVAALYVVSSILGLSAVVLTASDAIKAMLFLLTLVVVAYIAARVIFPREIAHSMQKAEESAAKPAETAETAEGEDQPMLSPKAAEGEHTVQVKEVVKIEDAEKNGGER
ncbi:MAG: hypothetical protein II094_04575, partial [Oscillospiraceae bacterium]|nr:hypothetical protein [Oscillospiraceae bacterium]